MLLIPSTKLTLKTLQKAMGKPLICPPKLLENEPLLGPGWVNG